jgi:[ribosomal protein S5]-alanine N-acetyltransferase
MIVRLREWRYDDSKALAEIANSKKIWDNVRDSLPHPYTETDAREWLEKVKDRESLTSFCVEVDGNVAGSIGVVPREDVYRKTIEIGYFIGEKFWGQGVGTEAVKQMLDFIKVNFDVVRVFAEVFEYNKASMRVLEKNGFYLETIRRKGAFKNGTFIDDFVWVKLL